MNKLLVLFCSCFIPFPKVRKRWRAKHLAHRLKLNQELSLEKDKTFEETIIELQNKIDNLTQLFQSTTAISNLPPAVGNMRIIQDCSITLLNVFDSLARRHHIQYWIDSGTLIGALRHGGFIPWDDDIDIAMLRPDYERLQSILKEEFNTDGFSYARGEITRLYYKNTPAQIDIFPIDIGGEMTPPVGEKYTEFVSWLNSVKTTVLANFDHLSTQTPTVTEENIQSVLSIKEQKIHSIEKGFLFYGVETLVKNRCVFCWRDVFPFKQITFENI